MQLRSMVWKGIVRISNTYPCIRSHLHAPDEFLRCVATPVPGRWSDADRGLLVADDAGRETVTTKSRNARPSSHRRQPVRVRSTSATSYSVLGACSISCWKTSNSTYLSLVYSRVTNLRGPRQSRADSNQVELLLTMSVPYPSASLLRFHRQNENATAIALHRVHACSFIERFFDTRQLVRSWDTEQRPRLDFGSNVVYIRLRSSSFGEDVWMETERGSESITLR